MPIERACHRRTQARSDRLARGIGFDLDSSVRPPELTIDGEPPEAGPHVRRGRVERVRGCASPGGSRGAPPGAATPRCGRGRDGGPGHRLGRRAGRAPQVVPGGAPRRTGRSEGARADRRPRARSREALGTRDDRTRGRTRSCRRPTRSCSTRPSSRRTRSHARALALIRERGLEPREPPSAPAVAVVGRQNVGKSTLVNRLFGSREAIAHEMPGVTRDRVELEATWRGRTLRLVDTGGFAHGAKGIEALVSDQAERAARAADVVLLVVDVQTGPVEEDASLARRLRRRQRCRSLWSSTRSTPSGTRRRCRPSTRSGSGTRSRSRPCTAGARETCWTRWSRSCPMKWPARPRSTRSQRSRSWAGRTSASRACSTGW